MMNTLSSEEQQELEEIINEMREEGEGSRGIFYENFGSAIRSSLVPLAELLEQSTDKAKALEVARKLRQGY